MSTTFTIKAPRLEEVGAAAALLNEHSRRLHGVDDTSPAELLQYWESPDVDYERDVLLAEAADSSILGYADIGVEGDHVWIDLRGAEPESLYALLDAIEQRAAEKKPGAGLFGFVSGKDELVRKIYEQAGYRVIRHSFRMEIALDGLPKPFAQPEAVEIRSMREDEQERVYEVHEESFEDAWMHTREPFEQWQHWFLKDPSYDPSLWFVAETGGEIVGVAICRLRASEPGLGWVNVLGVLRSHRRRGIGEALLHRAFMEFAHRGSDRVGLGVDAASPTGAVALYERAGMHVARTNLQFEKVQG
jgi:mycothiol synthase